MWYDYALQIEEDNISKDFDDETYAEIMEAAQAIMAKNGVKGTVSGFCLSDGESDIQQKILELLENMTPDTQPVINARACWYVCAARDRNGRCIRLKKVCVA